MQPIINPPTDNLYKFMAIAGLVIFLAAMTVPYKFAFDLDSEIQAYEESANKFVVQHDHLWLDIVGGVVNELGQVAGPNSMPRNEGDNENELIIKTSFDDVFIQGIDTELRALSGASTKDALRRILDLPEIKVTMQTRYSIADDKYDEFVGKVVSQDLDETLQTIPQRARRIREEFGIMRPKNLRLWKLQEWQRQLREYAPCFAGIGVGLGFIGFLGWWYKVQRWQDIVLRRQATEEKKS